MIGIKLDGQDKRLQLRRDTSISITLENPILGDVETLSPGSYSLPFDIPGGDESPENAALLKNPDVIENAEVYAINKALLEASEDDNPIPLLKGELKVRSPNGNSISTNFNFGLTSLSPEFKKKKLRELLDEEIVISTTEINKRVYIKSIYSFLSVQVNGKIYTGSQTQIVTDVNADADAAPAGELVIRALTELVGPSPGGLVAPYITFYIAGDGFVLRDPLTPLGVQKPTEDVTSEIYTDAQNINLKNYSIEGDLGSYFTDFETFIDSYNTEPYPNNKIRFPLIFNRATFNTDTSKDYKWTENVNAVDSNGLIKNNPNSQFFAGVNLNSLQPFVRLAYVLEKIFETYETEIEGDFTANADIMERLIDNSFLLDEFVDFTKGKLLMWKQSFNIADLVPDITVVDFLKAVASRYNVATYINQLSGKVRLQLREPLALSYVTEDISSHASPATPIDISERITGIKIIVPRDETDLFAEDDEVVVGDPQDEIIIKCGHILTTLSINIEGESVTGPRVNRKPGEKNGLRLFQYKGIIDNGTFTYAAAGITGDTFDDKLSGGDLYTNYHQYWTRFLINRKLVSLNVAFPLRMLTRIDWELKRRFDRNNYFIKSMNLRVTNSGVEVTDTKLYKV